MDRLEDTIAPELSNALAPQATVGGGSGTPGSVVELPMELKEFRKGRLVFRVPPAQASSIGCTVVCTQQCIFCRRFCIVCRCAQTHIA